MCLHYKFFYVLRRFLLKKKKKVSPRVCKTILKIDIVIQRSSQILQKEKRYTFCLQESFFLSVLRYLVLESQNRRKCCTPRTITKWNGSAKLPWCARLEGLRSPMAVSKGVRGISSTTFGHRYSQAPRTSPWLIAGLMESNLCLILIWSFPWLFVRFLS